MLACHSPRLPLPSPLVAACGADCRWGDCRNRETVGRDTVERVMDRMEVMLSVCGVLHHASRVSKFFSNVEHGQRMQSKGYRESVTYTRMRGRVGTFALRAAEKFLPVTACNRLQTYNLYMLAAGQ